MDKEPFKNGAILAARYAFMPNRLRYCGGDRNSLLFSYVCQNQPDQGLNDLLTEFETMHPYLKLIAQANKILDPFDYRVVEAYWIGNDLLKNVSLNKFYYHLIDEQKLNKKISPKLMEKVYGKIPLGAKPHHSWHVLNIPKRTGYYPVEHTLETLEKCRIGWGRVSKLPESKNIDSRIEISYQPVVFKDNKLILGEEITKKVYNAFDNQGFVGDLRLGDYVSFHWDWVCDRLSWEQVRNLKKWTQHNLNLANVL